jgi:ATP-dependent DNA helicase PIF1
MSLPQGRPSPNRKRPRQFADALVPPCARSKTHPTIAIAQFPLTLAWAVTIHKIQGCTLSHAQIDIGEGIFEFGQTYVALSRVRTMDGLYLLNFQPGRIKSNPKVMEFYESLTI